MAPLEQTQLSSLRDLQAHGLWCFYASPCPWHHYVCSQNPPYGFICAECLAYLPSFTQVYILQFGYGWTKTLIWQQCSRMSWIDHSLRWGLLHWCSWSLWPWHRIVGHSASWVVAGVLCINSFIWLLSLRYCIIGGTKQERMISKQSPSMRLSLPYSSCWEFRLYAIALSKVKSNHLFINSL